MSRTVVDVTQFARQPARSGIQRALGELADNWPADSDTSFVVRHGRGVAAHAPRAFALLIRRFFESTHSANAAIDVHRRLMEDGSRLPLRALDDAAILLPEPTYDIEVLDDLQRRVSRGQRVVAVVYDCFPMTHPWAFAGNGRAAESPYFRFLRRVPIAFGTSNYVTRVLVERLRRNPSSTPTAWLGSDHLQATSEAGASRGRSHFLMVGTVEPRKRLPLAVAAVELLHRLVPDAGLTIVGRPGWEEPAFLSRLAQLTETRGPVSWRQDCSDAEVASLLSKATALLSLGDEGFGLPVVESVAMGCPVLYGGEQPAATLLQGRGAWRLEDNSPQGIARTLMLWCEPSFAQRYAAKVDLDGLPVWRDFARSVANELLDCS